MEPEKKLELSVMANKQIQLCEEYGKARKASANAKIALDILLVAQLPVIRKERASIGYDMAVLRLLETNLDAREYYSVFKEQEARYKGLEKLADAHGSKLIMEQSLMKRDSLGEMTGR